MELTYIVNNVYEEDVTVMAQVGNRQIAAKIPGLVIEMKTEDGNMCHTFRMTPDDVEAAKAEYAIGTTVVATFTAQ